MSLLTELDLPGGIVYQRNSIVGVRNYKCLSETVVPRGPKGP